MTYTGLHLQLHTFTHLGAAALSHWAAPLDQLGVRCLDQRWPDSNCWGNAGRLIHSATVFQYKKWNCPLKLMHCLDNSSQIEKRATLSLFPPYCNWGLLQPRSFKSGPKPCFPRPFTELNLGLLIHSLHSTVSFISPVLFFFHLGFILYFIYSFKSYLHVFIFPHVSFFMSLNCFVVESALHINLPCFAWCLLCVESQLKVLKTQRVMTVVLMMWKWATKCL